MTYRSLFPAGVLYSAAIAQAAATKDRELAAQASALLLHATEREAAVRTRLLKWVCHEIQNPVTGVMGSLEVLELQARQPGGGMSAPQMEMLANARSCAQSVMRVRTGAVACFDGAAAAHSAGNAAGATYPIVVMCLAMYASMWGTASRRCP